ISARREALMKPRVIKDFLGRYDGNKVPRKDIAKNVLEQDLGVPRDACERTLELILSEARTAGLIEDNKGTEYVNLKGVAKQPSTLGPAGGAATEPEADEGSYDEGAAEREQALPPPLAGKPGA